VDGLFTPIFASALSTKGRTIEQIMKVVRTQVYEKSGRQQTPGEYNQLFEELFLGKSEAGDFSAEKIFAPTPYETPAPAPITKDEMVLVEGGMLPDGSGPGKSVNTFYIGPTEVTWLEWKKVRNWASDHGYDIGNAGAGSGNDHPVRNVSWYDVVKWTNAKSEMEGLVAVYSVNGTVYRTGEFGREGSSVVTRNLSASGYRLPTDAEWEWAARGGVSSQGYTYSGSNDLGAVAWYYDNSSGAAVGLSIGRGTWPVGQKAANELGIHDMSGNVFEWCEDLYGSFRRIRGGSWITYAGGAAVDYRINFYNPDLRNFSFGIRMARCSGL
jgi:formylglycine-generating enzyme required for sulfatase activity